MTSQDLVLGIETSCDDTSVALVDRQGNITTCVTASQFEIHTEYGGIYPELASRAHLQAILPTIKHAMDVIGGDIKRIQAIGVTRGPGLIGSLLIGINTAQALGVAWNKKVYGINHLRGHMRSPDLEERRIEYPAILLLVSGGHTMLCCLRSNCDITVLGETRDDSVGETYDKVARLLNLGMPGGPAIDKLANLGEPIFDFPRPLIRDGFGFSFSGLKSSVARLLEREPSARKEDVASSFVLACLDVLTAKLRRALNEYKVKSVVVVGGVAASPQLRQRVSEICNEAKIRLCLPPLKWATDNGAMIALAAWDYIEQHDSANTQPCPRLPLTEW